MQWVRRGILVFVLAGAQASAPTEDQFAGRVLRFEQNWNVFVRKYFGCPVTGPVTPEVCVAWRRQMDARRFAAAREEAKKLFDLQER